MSESGPENLNRNIFVKPTDPIRFDFVIGWSTNAGYRMINNNCIGDRMSCIINLDNLPYKHATIFQYHASPNIRN